VAEEIEPMAEDGVNGALKVFLIKDRLFRVEEFTGLVGPCERQGQQTEQLGDALGVDKVRILEVEAARFQGSVRSYVQKLLTEDGVMV